MFPSTIRAKIIILLRYTKYKWFDTHWTQPIDLNRTIMVFIFLVTVADVSFLIGVTTDQGSFYPRQATDLRRQIWLVPCQISYRINDIIMIDSPLQNWYCSGDTANLSVYRLQQGERDDSRNRAVSFYMHHTCTVYTATARVNPLWVNTIYCIYSSMGFIYVNRWIRFWFRFLTMPEEENSRAPFLENSGPLNFQFQNHHLMELTPPQHTHDAFLCSIEKGFKLTI